MSAAWAVDILTGISVLLQGGKLGRTAEQSLWVACPRIPPWILAGVYASGLTERSAPDGVPGGDAVCVSARSYHCPRNEQETELGKVTCLGHTPGSTEFRFCIFKERVQLSCSPCLV